LDDALVEASIDRSRVYLTNAVKHFKWTPDRKSTRLNSSHSQISYAVFCLKKKNAYVSVRTNTFGTRHIVRLRRLTGLGSIEQFFRPDGIGPVINAVIRNDL